MLLRVVNIAHEDFATSIQAKLVQHLRVVSDDKLARWYEEHHTGAKGRYCLCHSTHGGTNNNMGVEVDWRDMAKLCPASSTIGTFIGCLCHFVKELGKEHEGTLVAAGTPNAFISEPVIHKEIWDSLQHMHPLTLACSFVTPNAFISEQVIHKEIWDLLQHMHPLTLVCSFVMTGKGKKLDTALARYIGLIHLRIKTHLRIKSWHENYNQIAYPRIEDIKSMLVPSQRLLNILDPDGTLDTAELRELLKERRHQYEDIVLDNDTEVLDEMPLEEALDVYESFHHMTRNATWCKVPFTCTCVTSHAHCVCQHAVMLTSIFDRDLNVPAEYVAATPGLRKKTQKVNGTAGPKRARLLAQRRKETATKESKLQHMFMKGIGASKEQASAKSVIDIADLVIPEPEVPSSDDDDFMKVMMIAPS